MARPEPNLLSRGLLALAELLREHDANLSECEPAPTNSVRQLSDCKYLLLETITRDGRPAATPMCFASVDEVIFVRTGADTAKLARIRMQPAVRVAPCRLRGAPTGSYIECMARILPGEQEAPEEHALQRAHGSGRRLLNKLTPDQHAYLELTPIDRDELTEVTVLPRPARTPVHEFACEADDSPKDAA